KQLAETLAARFQGADAAAAARRGFEERFQRRHLDADALPEHRVAADSPTVFLPSVLRDAGLVSSGAEARRLIKQRAVRIDGETVAAEEYARGERTELVVEVGKRRAIRLRFG